MSADVVAATVHKAAVASARGEGMSEGVIRGRRLGRDEGMAEGIKQGRAEGADEAFARGRQEGATAERARISGILSHAEAASRPKLAQALALSGSMTVEQAAAILAAAGKEDQPDTSAGEQRGALFEAAMRGTGGGAGVGSGDGGAAGDGDGPDASLARTMAAAQAHGVQGLRSSAQTQGSFNHG